MMKGAFSIIVFGIVMLVVLAGIVFSLAMQVGQLIGIL
jgi:hypothetical protein